MKLNAYQNLIEAKSYLKKRIEHSLVGIQIRQRTIKCCLSYEEAGNGFATLNFKNTSNEI